MATTELSKHGNDPVSGEPERADEQRSQNLQRARDRLLATLVEMVAELGFAGTSIGELARRAGVSRGTFYELFGDKEACCLAAFGREQAALCSRLEDVRAAGSPLDTIAGELIELARSRPAAFEFIFHETLLAGPTAAAERDELVGWICHETAVSAEVSSGYDIPPRLAVEAIVRVLIMQVERGNFEPDVLRTELTRWLDCYRREEGRNRWSVLEPVERLRRTPPPAGEGTSLLPVAPRGRHGLSAEALRALQRQRIAYGTAEAIHRRGYADVTVSDIVASAGVSRDVFYAEFRDKSEAFDEAAKLVFEQLLATMASAYYGAAEPWPDRVWGAGEALARFLEDQPALAHFLFVGTSAPRPHVERINEYVLAFKVFVEDGAASSLEADLPPVLSEVLVCGVLAAATYQIRAGRTWDLRGLLPSIVYMVTAPFLGRNLAEVFVDERTAAAFGGS